MKHLWSVEEVIKLGINFILNRELFFHTFSVVVVLFTMYVYMIYDLRTSTFFENIIKLKI